jgi:hypothetical protein
MPRDVIDAYDDQLWAIDNDGGKERLVCHEPAIVEVVSNTCNRRIDRGIPVSMAVNKRALIRAHAENYSGPTAKLIVSFADFLDEKAGPRASRAEREAEKRIASGLCKFEDIGLIYKPGTKVIFDRRGSRTGGVIKICKQESWTSESGRRHRYMHIEIRCWHHSVHGFSEYTVLEQIDDFKHVRAISGLPLKIADDDEVARLAERGVKLREMAFGTYHAEYEGNMLAGKGGWYMQRRPATGRAIIDVQTLAKLDNELYRTISPTSDYYSYRDNDVKKVENVPDDELFAVIPTVIGFSLVNKSWGLFDLDRIRPAEYDKSAFDLLVLKDDVKRLLKSLIRQSNRGFTDIIRGKGGGTTILLHGRAGVGKTLTAEAVAELLERPLYTISVGELGSSPEELEKGLSTVLAYASAWNAVLLLDEADIYMERRDANNIKRNAMVAIFLRLLEYYNGVLLLTTNRVQNFDEAFHSRIALAINYPELEEDARRKVWENLFRAARITTVDPAMFAHYPLNGRQIKNTIRMAQNLAADDGVPVGPEHFEIVLGVVNRFRQDILTLSEEE